MDEKQVEVIKKVDGPVIRDRRKMGKPLTITRKRVAAYVRVSTNGEEQIQRRFRRTRRGRIYIEQCYWKKWNGRII